MTPQETLEKLGVTVESVFVPFSQSRNKDSKHPNLNWHVTVKRNGRDVLITDYSAGMAHCPSYNQGDKASISLCYAECEKGRKARYGWSGYPYVKNNAKRINPNPVDVLYSLTTDSDVLDFGCFKDWAANFGYDTDSRKAESTYHACLDIALGMRAGFGESGMAVLREVFKDY